MDQLQPEQPATCDCCGAEIVVGDYVGLGETVEGVRLARHCDDCRCKIVEAERAWLRDALPAEAALLTRPEVTAAVRYALTTQLIVRARNEGLLELEEPIIHAAGFRSVGE